MKQILYTLFILILISCDEGQEKKELVIFYSSQASTVLDDDSELFADFNFYIKEIKNKYKERLNYLTTDSSDKKLSPLFVREEFKDDVGFVIIKENYYLKYDGIFSLIDFEETLKDFEVNKKSYPNR